VSPILFEFRKLITRAAVTIVLTSWAAAAVITWLTVKEAEQMGSFMGDYQVQAATGLGVALGLPPMPLWIIALLPFVAWSSERSRGAYSNSYLSYPHPVRLLLAKWVAVVCISAATAVVVTVLAAGTTVLQSRRAVLSDALAQVVDISVHNTLYTLGLVSIGFGLAYIFRSIVAAVSIFFLAAWAVEPFVVIALTYLDAHGRFLAAVQYLPFRAIAAIQSVPGIGSSVELGRLSQSGAILEVGVISGFVLALCLVGARFRDPGFQ
jgi:ABC-type transport system involved in multi-copper enzyme maturation permease subunit